MFVYGREQGGAGVHHAWTEEEQRRRERRILDRKTYVIKTVPVQAELVKRTEMIIYGHVYDE